MSLRRAFRRALAVAVIVGALTLAASPSFAASELTVPGSPDPAPSTITIPMTELPPTGSIPVDPTASIGFALLLPAVGGALLSAVAGMRARRGSRKEV